MLSEEENHLVDVTHEKLVLHGQETQVMLVTVGAPFLPWCPLCQRAHWLNWHDRIAQIFRGAEDLLKRLEHWSSTEP